VIERKPDLVDAYIERGNLYTHVRRLDDAIADFDHAIELSPQNAKAYTMRALAKFQATPPPRKQPQQQQQQQAESVVAKQPADAQENGAEAEAATTPDAVATTTPDAAATMPDAAVTPTPDDVSAAPTDASAETPQAADATAVPSDQASNAALSDAQKALTLAPDDAFALRVRGDIYLAMGRNDEAIADYRQVLEQDPFQTESREALVKLDQDVPPEQGLPLGPPVSDWVIKEPSPGRYIASNPKYPKLRAELEMFGAGKPRILEWSQMKDALAGIGLLRYDAGDLSESGSQDLVYTAIIDLWANKVVSIEPNSWGAAAARWNWQAVAVVVTDPDGNANEIQLRKPKARPVAREYSGSSRLRAPSPAKGPARGRRGGGGGRGGFFGWFLR
jgi:tetratricopeptide (TPR) repeat protein